VGNVQPEYAQTRQSCRMFVPDCYSDFVAAFSPCGAVSLSTPETRRQLDKISRQIPLLVASCTGGFVPYQPHDAEVSGDKKFIPRRTKLDLKGNGE
jgi:hypothetical protein